jgi:hypothetical protein
MGFSVPNYDQYYQDAYNNKLKAYYERLLAEEQGDVDRAKRRLLEDYQQGTRINSEDYNRNYNFGRESYNAAMNEQKLDETSEQNKLNSDLVRRGLSQGGVSQQQTNQLQDRQSMRRAAIDRALKKSEDDLKYGKERGDEQETIKQRRGTEDLASQFAKFQTDKGQERQEKAQALAEADYGREFSKRSTEESFRLQQASLDKMG